MSTYTWGDISFMNHVLWITWFIKLDNTGIGLCPWPWCLAHAKVTPTQAQLQYRFDAISQFGFNEIDVWMVGPASREEKQREAESSLCVETYQSCHMLCCAWAARRSASEV